MRRRPGMFIGSTGPGGMCALVMEVVSNSVDEVLAGHADAIDVTLHSDRSVSVVDNGRELGTSSALGPVDAVRAVLTNFHTTATLDGHQPHVHLSFGTGLGPVAALCDRMVVEVRTTRSTATVTFSRGVEQSTSNEPADGGAPGTTVRIWPDLDIFTSTRWWRIETIQSHLLTLADLIPGLTVRFAAEPQTFGPTADLTHLFRETQGSQKLRHPGPFLIGADEGANQVRLALGWSDAPWGPTMRSFCNLRPTEDHGSHVEGIDEGLRLVFGQGPTHGLKEGLVAVLHVLLLEPSFAGPTKGRLDSPEAIWLVANSIGGQLPTHLDANPELRALLGAKHLAEGRP